MNTYSSQYYDLLSRAFRGDTSSKRLQVFIDSTLGKKYNGLDIKGFKFAEDMQLDFTYEQLQREIGITAMSTYYDLDSSAIPRADNNISLITGKIPRMKDVLYFNEDKLRKQLIVEKMFGENSDDSINSAKKKLYVTLDDLIGGHTNSLKYQRHQMVSAGKLTLTDKNNPKGIVGVTFSASIPSKNIDKASTGGATHKWWTDKGTYATEGTAADPIKDLTNWLSPIIDKGIKGHLEVNRAFFRRVLQHSKVLSKIALRLFPTSSSSTTVDSVAVLPENERARIFGEMIGVPVEVIDSLVAVEKYDKATKTIVKENINAFESDVFVFVPDGNIGEVLTVMPINFQSSTATYGKFYGGRLLLTVEADAVKKCQGFYSEMTSLVVPEVPQYMHYFYPND